MSEVLITLRPDLRESLQQSAEGNDRTLDELVNEAVAEYVRAKQRQKIDEEIAAFRKLHSELLVQYPGEWVAIHQGRLVDHDADRAALYRRVRAAFGQTAILIRQVTPTPDADVHLWTPGTGEL